MNLKYIIEKTLILNTKLNVEYVEETDEPSVFAKCKYGDYTVFLEHFLEKSYYEGRENITKGSSRILSM